MTARNGRCASARRGCCGACSCILFSTHVPLLLQCTPSICCSLVLLRCVVAAPPLAAAAFCFGQDPFNFVRLYSDALPCFPAFPLCPLPPFVPPTRTPFLFAAAAFPPPHAPPPLLSSSAGAAVTAPSCPSLEFLALPHAKSVYSSGGSTDARCVPARRRCGGVLVWQPRPLVFVWAFLNLDPV